MQQCDALSPGIRPGHFMRIPFKWKRYLFKSEIRASHTERTSRFFMFTNSLKCFSLYFHYIKKLNVNLSHNPRFTRLTLHTYVLEPFNIFNFKYRDPLSLTLSVDLFVGFPNFQITSPASSTTFYVIQDRSKTEHSKLFVENDNASSFSPSICRCAGYNK